MYEKQQNSKLEELSEPSFYLEVQENQLPVKQWVEIQRLNNIQSHSNKKRNRKIVSHRSMGEGEMVVVQWV